LSGQLPLDLPPREDRGGESFFVSAANASARAQIAAWRRWPDRKLALAGPAGSGKSHLAELWVSGAGGVLVRGAALAEAADVDLVAMVGRGAVAIDDADRLAGDPAGEARVLHLHNMLAEAGGALLVTGQRAPRDWPFTLPDLASRIIATTLATLDPPDDALLSAVLVKLFADRQLRVAPGLVSWLVARMERSFDAARAIVAALDARALADGRPIGPKLAAEILEALAVAPGGDT
jgi:chromosomal replication initiation ATPase DnaA